MIRNFFERYGLAMVRIIYTALFLALLLFVRFIGSEFIGEQASQF